MKDDVRFLVNQLVNDFCNDNIQLLFREKTNNLTIIEDYLFFDNKDSNFDKVFHLGDIELENEFQIIICTIFTNNELSDKSGKKAQYEIARKILKQEMRYSAGLFFFYDNKKDFRLSLVYDIPEAGGKRSWSNFKRYTYYVSKDQTNNTFINTFSDIKSFDTLDTIIQAFSVEKVTKEFYQEIALLFTKLTGGERKIGKNSYKENGVLIIPSLQNDNLKKEFAVRLLGRLLFCWFLKKKKSKNNLSLISDDVLSINAVNTTDNYYHNTVEPLFFEILNTKMENRLDKFNSETWSITPFLNGGLFEPGTSDFYERDNTLHISRYINTLVIPNDWFSKLFEVFDRYNFTIDENTTNDAEISIDPEMLGKLFENLLAEINEQTGDTARKSTGSFYTPRPIVDYMVNESLLAYLEQKLSDNGITDSTSERLRKLFNNYDVPHNFSQKEVGLIIDALDNLKVLDPACGSGAFPMGVLHTIQMLLQKLDPECKLWLNKVLDDIKDQNARRMMESKLKDDSELFDFTRKLGIIQKSIYGVDIQEIAVEISKLRCFLSIIVEEKIDDSAYNRGIQPLPNLEFKFVAANTLIGLTKPDLQTRLFDINDKYDELRKKREEYFSSLGGAKKVAESEYIKIQGEITDILIKDRNLDKDTKEFAQKLAGWNPFEHKSSSWFDSEFMFGIQHGFDIVIGNPPYIQIQKFSGQDIQKAWNDQNYATYCRTGDIYALFIEKGINILNNSGLLTFITSNKWMRAGYGDSLRDFLASKSLPAKLIDFGGYKVFEAATVDTNILITSKSPVETNNYSSLHNKYPFYACTIADDFNSDISIADYFERHKQIMPRMNKSAWIISSDIESKIKEKIEAIGTPLKDWDINIYRGVLTGFNEAFIIDGKKKDELIAKDPKSAEIIKPILRGRDIKRYKADFADLWLINSHNGIKDKGIKRIDVVNDYSAIYNHLKQYEKELIKRQDKGDHWTNLRNCAYLEEFEKEKIVYNDICQTLTFSIVEQGMYFNNTAYFISYNNNIKYLTSILNSSLINWYYRTISVQLGEKAVRMFSIYVNKLPIPKLKGTKIEENLDKIITEILQIKSKGGQTETKGGQTEALERQIDLLVYDLYSLSAQEIAIIEKSKSK